MLYQAVLAMSPLLGGPLASLVAAPACRAFRTLPTVPVCLGLVFAKTIAFPEYRRVGDLIAYTFRTKTRRRKRKMSLLTPWWFSSRLAGQ